MEMKVIQLRANTSLPAEQHHDATQFFYVRHGSGTATIDGNTSKIVSGSAFYVPRGIVHSVMAGLDGLRMFTIYSPPEHHTQRK